MNNLHEVHYDEAVLIEKQAQLLEPQYKINSV